VEPTLKPKLNPDTLFSDLQQYAQISEVPFNPQAVRQLLDLFGDIYPEATAVSIRTTTHPIPQRDVNFRYMETEIPHNPFERLKDAGLLPLEGHPVEKVIPEVSDRYPVWWGVDVAVSRGFEKIWAFLKTGVPVDEFLTLPCLPDSARNLRDHLKKFAPPDIIIVGVDFKNKTMNLYPSIIPPESYEPNKIAAMIADLGFSVPSDEVLQCDSRTVNFYYTLSWAVPTAQRLCYAIPAPPEALPTHWFPLFKRFVERVPFQAERRMFAYNPTYGPRGGYVKIEADYLGNLQQIFSYWNN
jgi:aromatic prenyltransferase